MTQLYGSRRDPWRGRLGAVACAALVLLGPATARADEAFARQQLRAMSDYLAGETAIALTFDTVFEVVTPDAQKLALTSSGTLQLQRPDKLHVTRKGGFADLELFLDGQTLTIFGKNLNLYAEAGAPGTIDAFVDEMRDVHGRPVPGADLIVANVYDALMENVVDVKDVGVGVVGGVVCNHFAFRTDEVDWQIWIADGDTPYPCRYVITARDVPQAPQYSLQISGWRTGAEAALASFSFVNTTDARRIEFADLPNFDLPENFTLGDAQ